MNHTIAPITGRRIRVGLVGCGRISCNHIKAIALHHERVELSAICDTQSDRLVQAQQLIAEVAVEYPGAATDPVTFNADSDLWDAVKSGAIELDLVVLATPSGFHQVKL